MRAADAQDAMRALPIGTLETIVPGKAMILAPHPDDESLGCGGLIAACCALGRPPLVVVVTDGAASHRSAEYPPARLRVIRETEARAAVAGLGLPDDHIVFLDLPDAACPAHPPEIDVTLDRLIALSEAFACNTILASWGKDPHCDHEAVWAIATTLAERIQLSALAYPVWGWLIPGATELEIAPPQGWRLDIGAHLAAKKAAIEAHRSQYGGLITDDANGFTLPHALLEACLGPYETFLRP